jgi:tight adherence protein C
MLPLVIAAALLTVALYLVIDVITVPERARAQGVQRAARYGARRFGELANVESFNDRVGRPLRAWLAGVVLRFSPHTTVETVRLKLVAAGLGRRLSPQSFLAAKAGLAILGLLGGLAVGTAVAGAGAGLLLALALAGLGYLAPDTAVGMRTRSRRESMQAQLPHALDLLAVSVEAGLSFDSAVAKLTEQMAGPLVDDFELMLAEIRMGASRENALKMLAERSGVPEVASFARAMIQADRLGVSIARLLRSQATETRLKRQAAAEEKAMKAPIKMLFPTVLFIFPALFLVVLAPAFINLFELF